MAIDTAVESNSTLTDNAVDSESMVAGTEINSNFMLTGTASDIPMLHIYSIIREQT